MLFNSLDFLIFFSLVVTLYFAVPQKFRWVLLLTASYYFYMLWKPEYVILIVASTLTSYYTGIKMGQIANTAKRKTFLMLSLLSNLGLLFVFKYFNFFNDSFRALFNSLDLSYGVPTLDVLLPVGISFYTFQTLSYSIDVYRGKREPEKHLGIFALYVSFFPQLVAGPIERSTRLVPQFHRKHEFNYSRITSGLQLMLWGFFKKLVIADRAASFVDTIYSRPSNYTGSPLIIATYLFAFQIYCDFSAYSDIAIGVARIMGYNLVDNFKRPYFSSSISEFWQRWHISLSSWFRDYLYIPLGGNRVTRWRWYFNLLVVFLISGLWHGANWTFVIWGALHGFYLIFSIWTQNTRSRVEKLLYIDRYPNIQKFLRIFITFHLVVFAWIFFRANSVLDAFYIVNHLFIGIKPGKIGLGEPDILVLLVFIAFMVLIHLLQERGHMLSAKPTYVRWISYYFLALSIVVFGVYDTRAFVYFQF